MLKGGFLLLYRHVNPFRPTVDTDLLGISIPDNPEHLSAFIGEIAGIDLKDGVQFETDDMTETVIKRTPNAKDCVLL